MLILNIHFDASILTTYGINYMYSINMYSNATKQVLSGRCTKELPSNPQPPLHFRESLVAIYSMKAA